MMGYFLALLSGVFAGVTVAVGKMATGTMTSAFYVLIMSILALMMTFAFEASRSLIFKGKKHELGLHHYLQFPNSNVLNPLAWHVVFSAIAMWTFWEGTKHMEAAIASFSVRIELVFVLIASRIFFKEKLTRSVIAGAILVVLGTGVMGSQIDSVWTVFEHLKSSKGLWLMIISGAAFAGAECFANILAPMLEPTALVIWRSISLTFIFALVAVTEGGFMMPSTYNLVIIGLAALFGPVLARICFMFALRRIELGKASLLSQTEPVVTAIVAFYLLGEKLRPLDILGATAILIGCMAISVRGPATSLHSD